MARINPALFERLEQKFGLSRRRVYALIDEKVRATHLPGHLAAIVLASERGIIFPDSYLQKTSQKFGMPPGVRRRHQELFPAAPRRAWPVRFFLMIGLFWFLKLPF